MRIYNYFFQKTGRLALYTAGITAFMLASCSPEKQGNAAGQILPNEFGKAATQMGVKTCAPLFSVLGQTLTANLQYSAKLVPDKNDSNGHALTAIIGQFYGTDTMLTKGAGTLYAAPVNGACEGVLVRTLLMPQSCTEVAQKQLPPGTKRQDDLAQTAVFAMPEGGYIMMMPATQTSCIVTMTMALKDG